MIVVVVLGCLAHLSVVNVIEIKQEFRYLYLEWIPTLVKLPILSGVDDLYV